MPRPKNKLTLKQRRLVQRGINLVLGKIEDLSEYYCVSAEYLHSKSGKILCKEGEALDRASGHLEYLGVVLASQFGLYETNNGNVCSNVEGV